MTEINSRTDIEFLVNEFYQKIKNDALLHPVFDQFIGNDWDTHLDKMYQFWETVLFDTIGYKGSPVRKHMELNNNLPLTEKMFQRWIELWDTTVDLHFKGERAQEAKKRAQYMAMLMNYKMNNTAQ
jgi:hemoglobin